MFVYAANICVTYCFNTMCSVRNEVMFDQLENGTHMHVRWLFDKTTYFMVQCDPLHFCSDTKQALIRKISNHNIY